MTEMIELIKPIHEFFWHNNIYIFLYLFSIGGIAFFRKKFLRGNRVFLGYSVTCVLGFAYNPIFLLFAYRFFFSGPTETVRIFLILPVIFTEAYFMAQLMEVTSSKWKYLVIAGMIFLFFRFGCNSYQRDFYIQPENIYKIPNSSIEVSEMILDDTNQKRAIAYIQDWQENNYFGGSFNHGIRMYTSKIQLQPCEASDEELMAMSQEEKQNYYNDIIEKMSMDEVDAEYRYFVMRKEDEFIESLVNQGMVAIGTDQEYMILRVE